MKSFIFTSLSLMLFIAITILSLTPSIINASTSSVVSKISLSVFNENNEPIDNASLYVVETNEYHQTSKQGRVTILASYTSKNKISLGYADKAWNECTIITYKNGYLPHIIYGVKFQKGINRVGVVITLTPLTKDTSLSFTTSYDYPPLSYTESLVTKHKP